MQKIRPLGVMIFAVLMVYFIGEFIAGSAFAIGKLFPNHSIILQNDNTMVRHQIYLPSLIGQLFWYVFQIGILIASIVGTLRLKKWGYYLLITYAIASAVLTCWFFFIDYRRYDFIFIIQHHIFWESLLNFGFFMGLIFYFLQPHIKTLFLKAKENEEILIDKWSDITLFLSWGAIYFGMIHFYFFIKHAELPFNLQSFAFGWSYYLLWIIFGAMLLWKSEISRKFLIGFCSYSIFLRVFSGTSPMSLIQSLIMPILYIIILNLSQIRKVFR